ncbi:MAG: twin-arginine translocase TatA/TatE family subunit [Planctomycetota bacterium]|nr:MAG: twin-arginine translocase TatA/TatE family subunit [Planctomycetota bacterium]
MPGGWEWLIIAAIGLLIFGRRLPEVGRGLGRSIVEFRKGIKGIEDEIEAESSKPAPPERIEGRSQAGPAGTAPFQAGEAKPAPGAGDSA